MILYSNFYIQDTGLKEIDDYQKHYSYDYGQVYVRPLLLVCCNFFLLSKREFLVEYFDVRVFASMRFPLMTIGQPGKLIHKKEYKIEDLYLLLGIVFKYER